MRWPPPPARAPPRGGRLVQRLPRPVKRSRPPPNAGRAPGSRPDRRAGISPLTGDTPEHHALEGYAAQDHQTIVIEGRGWSTGSAHFIGVLIRRPHHGSAGTLLGGCAAP